MDTLDNHVFYLTLSNTHVNNNNKAGCDPKQDLICLVLDSYRRNLPIKHFESHAA